MGDNYLDEQAKYAKRRRAKGRKQLHQGGLFVRPDIMERFYTVVPAPSGNFVKDEVVIAMKNGDPDRLAVLRENRVIGSINGDGAKSLISAMGSGVQAVPMRVTSVGSLSGVGKTELLKGISG
jgi:hypothetical protein